MDQFISFGGLQYQQALDERCPEFTTENMEESIRALIIDRYNISIDDEENSTDWVSVEFPVTELAHWYNGQASEIAWAVAVTAWANHTHYVYEAKRMSLGFSTVICSLLEQITGVHLSEVRMYLSAQALRLESKYTLDRSYITQLRVAAVAATRNFIIVENDDDLYLWEALQYMLSRDIPHVMKDVWIGALHLEQVACRVDMPTIERIDAEIRSIILSTITYED